MGETNVDKIKCIHCGADRIEGDMGPCPVCGKKGRTISVYIKEDLILSGSLNWKHTREYYEKNRSIHLIVLIITVASPFTGLFLAGIPGVIFGVIFGVFSYILGAKFVIKVREIRHGR